MWRKMETNLTHPLKISDPGRDKMKENEFSSVQTFTQFFLPSPLVLPLHGLQDCSCTQQPCQWCPSLVKLLASRVARRWHAFLSANTQPRDVSSDIRKSTAKTPFHQSPRCIWGWNHRNCSLKLAAQLYCEFGFQSAASNKQLRPLKGLSPHSFYWHFYICMTMGCTHTPAHRHCMVPPGCLEHESCI